MNRAREGLRVIEEIGRFYLTNEAIFLKLKTVRHMLKEAELLLGIDAVFFRDVESDVGKAHHASELKKGGLNNLLKANAKRAQESLRVLEELGNLYGRASELFKKARFEVYEIEKELLLALPKEIDYSLYLVTDNYFLSKKNIFSVIEDCVNAGITVIQYRAKEKNTREMLQEALLLKKITEKHNIPLIINDRIDIALAVDAEGVHLGQKDMPYEVAKMYLGDKIIGLSASSIAEAKDAISKGADYIGLGPIFETTTKKDASTPCGVNTLKQLKTEAPFSKIVAIGGIDLENAQQLIEVGVDGLAIISAILASQDPIRATQLLKHILQLRKKD